MDEKSESSKTEIQEFYDRVVAHDWFYQMSDDGRVFRRGEADMLRLARWASEIGPEAVDILDGMKKHHFSGQSFGTEKAPMPPRPE